jgi:hypothetical protein
MPMRHYPHHNPQQHHHSQEPPSFFVFVVAQPQQKQHHLETVKKFRMWREKKRWAYTHCYFLLKVQFFKKYCFVSSVSLKKNLSKLQHEQVIVYLR